MRAFFKCAIMALNYFARVFPEKTYWRNIMQLLEEKIKTDGIAVNEDILKEDSFINHKVDPFLMKEIGKDFAAHFADQGITKIVTIESSGIAPALTTDGYSQKTAIQSLKQKPLPDNGYFIHKRNKLRADTFRRTDR